MNRKIVWIAAGLAALAVLAVFVWRKQATTQAGSATAQVFSIADTGAVSRVVITRRSGGRHVLERRPGNFWMLDSAQEVAPALAGQLLMTLHDLKVKRPCTRKEREAVVKRMATDNIKVDVFTAGEPARTFFLGSSTDEAQGNYALLDGSEEPVVVNLPNFQGYVSPRFEVEGASWRSKHLFRSTARTLQSVKVTYPETPAENIELTFKGGTNYALAGVDRIDTARLSRFLTTFQQVYIEAYQTDTTLRDSLSKAAPFAVITVRDLDPNKSHELRLFAPAKDRMEYLSKQDRILGYIADQKLAITIQPQNYQPLLMPKSFFERPKA